MLRYVILKTGGHVMKNKRRRIVMKCALVGVLLVGSSIVFAEDLRQQCEAGAREIASAYGSQDFEKRLDQNFPDRERVLSMLEQARSEGNQLRLRLLKIENLTMTKPGECVARVQTQAEFTSGAGTPQPIGPISTTNWRIRLPAERADEPSEEPPPDQWLLGSHRGAVHLRVHWFLPEGQRDEVLSLPDAKESGLKPSEIHPRAVVFPDQPAAGWFVRIGDQQTMVSADGRFALDVTDDSPAEGQIINPGTGVVYATFQTSTLIEGDRRKPEPIIVDLASFGGCGMDHGDPTADPACKELIQGVKK